VQSPFASNLLCKWNLISRPNGNIHARYESAAGNVDQIHTRSLQDSAQLDGLRQVQPPSFQSVAETLKTAASVRAQISRTALTTRTQSGFRFSKLLHIHPDENAQRRKKFVDQVAMPARESRALQTCMQRPCRRPTKRFDHFADFVWCERTWHRIVARKKQRARRQRVPSVRFQRHFLASQPRAHCAPLRPACANCIPATALWLPDELGMGLTKQHVNRGKFQRPLARSPARLDSRPPR